MKRLVRTKIICTLGPASSNVTAVRKMMLAGMDVARLNFSHGNHSEHLHRIKLIKSLNNKYKRHIRILQDLEGLRIRIGELRHRKAIGLRKKQIIYLSNKNGDKEFILFDYHGPLTDIKRGNFIYIDDGNIALLAKSITKNYIKAEVVVPGLIKENKGINIPGVNLRFKGLTQKDKADLRFGIEQGVDFIAQSFVRNRKDIIAVRNFIKHNNFDCKLIAKIENREGIKNIDQILGVCDGIMIARGDMGVSLPIYEVPIVQKMIIKKCNQRKKFVITATQMLESMTENTRPTRAEVSDVANAILDGSDCLMLSAETATGRYPVQTVKMMNDIIRFTEFSTRQTKHKFEFYR